jgi:hypothetical protein
MPAVVDEVAASQIRQSCEGGVAVDDEHAGVRRSGAVLGAVDRRAEQRGLAAVDRLQRISADLGQQRVALDPFRHRPAGEVETSRQALDALALQLAPDRLPEMRIDGLHLGQIVHWQAHAPMRFRFWLWHHRSLDVSTSALKRFGELDAEQCRVLGVLPSPLWGGGGGGGRAIEAPALPHCTSPLPSPPPQGGREQTELAARADSTSTRTALAFQNTITARRSRSSHQA